MIQRGLRFLGAGIRWVLPAGILIGLLSPGLAHLAHPLLTPSIVLLLTVSMLSIDWAALRLVATRPIVSILALGWLLVVVPLLVAVMTAPFGLPDDLRRCLILVAAMPPILSGPALAGLAGLDAATSLVVLILATLMVPLSLPAIIATAVDVEVSASPLALFLRLSAVVGGSILAGAVIRRWVGSARLRALTPDLRGFSVVLLLVFALAIMDGMQDLLSDRPKTVIYYTLAAFGLNLGMQALGLLAFRPAGMHRAVTLGFLSGNRNAGLLLTVLSGDPALLLFVAAAQFPIYLLPSLLLPLYRRMAGTAAA